ncbi:MAG: GAF domain-containing protein, partial [Chloroflexi bacterium]|nr:GAF domain-containing protein [Chloroflexota bacterium]
VGTRGGGLDRLDRERNRFIHYRADPYDPHSLSQDDVWCLYQDRGGVLWVGTFGGGVNKANRVHQKFVHYRHDPENPNSLSDNRVLSICEDQSGLLWIGTYASGLNRLDRQSGQWTRYEHDPSDPHSLSHNTVRSIYEDRTGALWIGTEGGLDRFNRETGRFVHYRHDAHDPFSLSSNSVGPIYEDRQGILWVGTAGGLNRLDRASGRFTRYQHNPDDAHSLSHNTVSTIFETSDGLLWVGTLGGGLNRFGRESAEFTAFRHDPNDGLSLGSDMVLCIAQDSRDRLYVGTWGAGFDRFDPKTGKFIHFRERNGLPNDVVYGIVADSAGALWVSTNRGLAKFNTRTLQFRAYDVSDGLQSNEFSRGAYYRNKDDELFFGGINGLSVFYPPAVYDNPAVPPVVITAFRKLDRTILTDIATDQTIQLSYTDNFIAFEFAALDYTASPKNQYQYKLEGFDPGWIDAGTRRYQSYSNLKGGRYIFHVRGSNNDGVWNQDGIAVYINVRPPVWETWWFRVGLALLVVGSAVEAYRWRVRSIQARTTQLEALVDERTFEIQRRRLVAEGLREILVLLNSNRTLKESLDYIASEAALLTGAEQTVIFQCQADDVAPTVIGCHTPRVHSSTSEEPPYSALQWIAQAVWTGESLVIPDLDSYRAAERPRSAAEGAANPDVPIIGEHRAMLGFPMSSAGQVYGGLALFYAERQSFSQEDLDLGLTLVDQAALAIANAQLRERVEQLAAESERTRLARDLHDAVTQTLFSASLIAEVLPSVWDKDHSEGLKLLGELRQLSRGAMAEMRTLLLELRPAALAETDLADLLRQLAEATAGRTGLPVAVVADGCCTLPPDVHVALYRIAQEALNNVT